MRLSEMLSVGPYPGTPFAARLQGQPLKTPSPASGLYLQHSLHETECGREPAWGEDEDGHKRIPVAEFPGPASPRGALLPNSGEPGDARTKLPQAATQRHRRGPSRDESGSALAGGAGGHPESIPTGVRKEERRGRWRRREVEKRPCACCPLRKGGPGSKRARKSRLGDVGVAILRGCEV